MAGSGPGGMISAPASKDNGGCAHCSAHGLLAYGAGSCVVVVDVRSMQLVVVLPMPALPHSPTLSAPFVTALQWIPECISRDLTQDISTSHLQVAVGDRQGRIAIWDIASKEVIAWLELESDKGRLGIQDMCWVLGHAWLLSVIHGPSLLVIWDCQQGRPLWRHDAGAEVLACIRCDPFDARQMCVLGLKGVLISALVGASMETEVATKQFHITIVEDRTSGNLGGATGGKEAASGSGSTSAGVPALASVPGNVVRAMYSTKTRGLLYIVFPREIVVFDLKFGMCLGSTGLPRGCGKFLDVLAVADGEILYCAHQDGKLSAWKKREGRQVFGLSYMESLLPPMGTPVPAPMVLAVVHCPLQLHPQNLAMEEHFNSSLQLRLSHDNLTFSSSKLPSKKSGVLMEATFISISDDGRLWQWELSAEMPANSIMLRNSDDNGLSSLGDGTLRADPGTNAKPDFTILGTPPSTAPIFKMQLTMQLQLLPSPVTTLAVPVPSQHAIFPGGGGGGAVSVPLVALATQGGTLELVDAAANAVTFSIFVHSNSIVRGVRWLGNSRLVSFSYTEVKGKGGGFVNKLAVSCVRSGHSRLFRILQKPERAPMRALRTSPSGRYLLILFRDAPAEVWAMTRIPQMLRSLALPFTVMEWALPRAPKSSASARKPSVLYKERSSTIAATVAAAKAPVPGVQQSSGAMDSVSLSGPEPYPDTDMAESFAFALVNGSLGVFELRGKRVRDFRPKWPAASFVSADVLVTAMAYRMPHVVMGDRMGNIRWWDVTSGLSSLFNTHRGGIRRIRFAPVTLGDTSRGRIAVLFNDHTFSVFDLDTQDPLANALVQPQLGGILVLELDWFPLRADMHEPLLLCIAGADGSFRLLEVYNTQVTKTGQGQQVRGTVWQRFRPVTLCSAALLPRPHALALRMVLQLGVQPSWFYAALSSPKRNPGLSQGTPFGTRGGDLRHYLLKTSLPVIGETVAAEVLLKALEPYRSAGRLLNSERANAYATICNQGVAARAAFSAAHFGEYPEAVFWLQLPTALALLNAGPSAPLQNSLSMQRNPNPNADNMNDFEHELKSSTSTKLEGGASVTMRLHVKAVPPIPSTFTSVKLPFHCMDIVPGEPNSVYAAAQERITWHEKLVGVEATQKRVHEFVIVGDFEAAVTLLLSTPPDSPNFYLDALRAVSLASAVSPAMHELAVKVVAANMVGTDDSLSGTHLLCAVGRYQEACSQLQDSGRWMDASILAATHLKGTDHARVLERWAEHVLRDERNLWRAMIIFVAAGALSVALATLRNAQLPDTSALFLLACHEAKAGQNTEHHASSSYDQQVPKSGNGGPELLDLPGDLKNGHDSVLAVCEFFGQYQRNLAHLCSGTTPAVD